MSPEQAIAANEVPAEAKPIIVFDIFVARRRSFRFVAPGVTDSKAARLRAFHHLPLEENGWSMPASTIRHVGNEPAGMLWALSRGEGHSDG